MATAHIFASLSNARRLKVGCVITSADRIISIGYNGTPKGRDNDCEDTVRLPSGSLGYVTKPEVLHAESNAIAKLARSNDSGLDASMFCTHSPCFECSKLIYQSGIKELWYQEAYRDTSGIDLLSNLGVQVFKFR